MVAPDPNLEAASLLYDMAALQPNERSQLGYKRAAKAITGLSVPVGDLVASGRLRDVPFVGPASARVIQEYVEAGGSATVDAAVTAAGQRSKIDTLRGLRRGFLSEQAMRNVLAAALPADVVSPDQCRGDFQMHSTWSDGGETLAAMIEGCVARGHTCLGITDHSHGLPVARGMTMETVVRQHHEIDELNATHAGRFRVFKGIEANILADGSLDLSEEERARFEFVVASPHSGLRQPGDQTARMVAAVSAPGVTILGHPRGRMFNTRAGIQADWPRVFAAAASRGVAIELDGNWHRQDVDAGLAGQALAAGCLFALDSDAHSIAELRYTDYSVAHARLAGVPTERVINCWSDEQLSAWMASPRAMIAPPERSAKGARGRGAAR